MSKLYPPYIESSLPAFYGDSLTIPFSMNVAVAKTEVAGIKVKVKKINTNEIVYEGVSSYSENLNTATFEIKDTTQFKIGQFYRVQLAYVSKIDSSIGYYSSVGIIKYTARPEVSIEKLLPGGQTNSHIYNYVGRYYNPLDVTEKLYSSHFVLKDYNGNIIQESGEIIHLIKDEEQPNEGYEEYDISRDLDLDTGYYLNFVVTTINGLTVSSPRYLIYQQNLAQSNLKAQIIAVLDHENGRVQVHMKTDDPKETYSGTYVICKSSKENGDIWEKVKYLQLIGENPNRVIFDDNFIEQGHTYRYSLQEYNSYGVHSARIISNDIYTDFEDMFICDAEKQLKIRFNPTVSSFKINTPETKIDTIGSKYPYFSRNGKIKYHEFPIGGLLSYWNDNSELFVKYKDLNLEPTTYYRDGTWSANKELGNINIPTTQLVGYNYFAEREFKNRVLEWLADGKPKVFKSPTEGNYIVRLMNPTLTPNTVTSRLLHSFTATAYECDDFTYEALNRLGFVDTEEHLRLQERWASINLLEQTGKLPISNTYKVLIDGAYPNTKFKIDGQIFYIGNTGYFKFEKDTPIMNIEVLTPTYGVITYNYFSTASNTFEEVVTTKYLEAPCKQIINRYNVTDNAMDKLENIKLEIAKIRYIRFRKRRIVDIYTKYTGSNEPTNQWVYYMNGLDDTSPVRLDSLEKAKDVLYRINWHKMNLPDGMSIEPIGYYYDPISTIFVKYEYEDISHIAPLGDEVIVNGERISLKEKEIMYIKNADDIKTLLFGHLLICEMGYQGIEKSYSFEEKDENLVEAKKEYEQMLKNYLEQRRTIPEEQINPSLEEIQQYYEEYLIKLEECIEDYEQSNNVDIK